MIDIREPDQHRVDFFLLHSLNMLPMWPSILNHPWIPRKDAVRLLEWMGRYFVLLYIAERSPEFKPNDIDKYQGSVKPWSELFERSIDHKTDDGHLPKAIRALAWGQEYTRASPQRDKLLMKDGNAWLRLANLSMSAHRNFTQHDVECFFPMSTETESYHDISDLANT